MQNAGFYNINLRERIKSKKGWLDKENSVLQISVNGQAQFSKGEWFSVDSQINITYLAFEGAPEK